MSEMDHISEGGLQSASGWVEKMLHVHPTNPLISDVLSKYDPYNDGMFVLTQLLGIYLDNITMHVSQILRYYYSLLQVKKKTNLDMHALTHECTDVSTVNV